MRNINNELGNCPICQAPGLDLFWGSVWGAKGKKVMRCNECESYSISPPETRAQQNNFDVAYDQYIQERSKEVLSNKIDIIGNPGVIFDELVDESINIRYQDLKPYFSSGDSILEVGAEKGGFLNRIKGNFKKISAVDSCPEYKEMLKNKGYDAHSYIDDLPSEATFDRICLFSLLEHILNPKDFLIQIRDRLSVNGLVIIEVPSATEPLISLYDIDKFKSFYFQSMHPYVYSPKAIEYLLNRCGLSVEKLIYKQRYGLANHLHWLNYGTPGEGKYNFFNKYNFCNGYKEMLEELKKTDTIYIIAKKNVL